MRVFQTKWFGRWAESEGLSQNRLCAAVEELEAGLIDAQLGGALVKKRVAATGRGKSGSYRTIIAYRARETTFFLFGFAKNDRDNIERRELEALKKLAKELLGYDAAALDKALKEGALSEIRCDEQDP